MQKQQIDVDAAIRTYRLLIQAMPPANRYLLLYVLDLLAVFARKSDTNLMPASSMYRRFVTVRHSVLRSHRLLTHHCLDITQTLPSSSSLEYSHIRRTCKTPPNTKQQSKCWSFSSTIRTTLFLVSHRLPPRTLARRS